VDDVMDMSDYPAGSTAKQYDDGEGNKLSLRQMVLQQPEWAVSRIKICEGLESIQRWIPVSERLPENGTGALVYVPESGLEYADIRFDYWEDGVWVAHSESYEHYMAPYTHWMPLPTPPGE
jgi:hypothetical protein